MRDRAAGPDGMQNKEIAQQLGVGRVQVSRWRERHASLRLAGMSVICRGVRRRPRSMLRAWWS